MLLSGRFLPPIYRALAPHSKEYSEKREKRSGRERERERERDRVYREENGEKGWDCSRETAI